MEKELLDLALRLPACERAEIANALLASLEDVPADEDVEPEWSAEINHRLEKVARGDYRASDWREAMERIRDRLAQKKPS